MSATGKRSYDEITQAVLELEAKDLQHQLELREKDLQHQLELREKDLLIRERNDLLIRKNNLLIRERNLQIEELDRKLKAVSLYTAIDISSEFMLVLHGTQSTHMNVSNHGDASMISETFTLPENLIAKIDILKEKTKQDPKLEEVTSQMMAKVLSSDAPPSYHTKADVENYVNAALSDATSICNKLIKRVAATNNQSSTKIMTLLVRHEMSLFSNRFDHAVVYDLTSNAPIFCVETKKHFGSEFHESAKNSALGQCLDQLKAMQIMGHPAPIGALTCFNETYLTSLSRHIGWDTPPTFESLQEILELLPGNVLPENSTPPPLIMKSHPSGCSSSQDSAGRFTSDKNRCIHRSDRIEQKYLVSTFVIIILQALKSPYVPKVLKLLQVNQRIDVACIQMTEIAYHWGKLCTTYKGPLISEENLSDTMYLIRCIGSGSTSKAFYAITQDGYDCVVKMYVRSITL